MSGRRRVVVRLCGAVAPVAPLLAVSPVAARPAPEPAYTVASVTFDLRVDDVVGARRSGSLCLPAGSIAWRDAKPDRVDAREAVTSAARGAGLTVGAADNPFKEGVAGVDRAIRVRVRGLRLTACVPAGGLGRLVNRSRLVKGEGLVAIEWRVFARGGDDPVATARTCTAFTYREDPGTLQGMTLAGLAAATTRIVRDLRTGTGGPTVIEDEGCRQLRLSEAASTDE